MPSFGKRSRERLDTCHPDLVKIAEFVVEIFDISILEGARSDERQFKLFQAGRSKLDGTTEKSNHQVTEDEPLSKAIDAAPYPIDFGDLAKARARFYMMSGYFFMAAEVLYAAGEITHKLRWGGDWDGDKNFNDQSFDDLPHMELVRV